MVTVIFIEGTVMAGDFAKEENNKTLAQASFDRWKSATGGPFELLAPDAEWTNCWLIPAV
jgi:hypothetical protein